MNRINNKHGPDIDVGFPVMKRPRDGTARKPRDGTEEASRDGTERMPRDEIIMRNRGIPSSKRRTPVRCKPANWTGNGRAMPGNKLQITNDQLQITELNILNSRQLTAKIVNPKS